MGGYGLTTIVSEMSPERRRMAETSDAATVTVDSTSEDLAPFITSRIIVDDVVEKAFGKLLDDRGKPPAPLQTTTAPRIG